MMRMSQWSQPVISQSMRLGPCAGEDGLSHHNLKSIRFRGVSSREATSAGLLEMGTWIQ